MFKKIHIFILTLLFLIICNICILHADDDVVDVDVFSDTSGASIMSETGEDEENNDNKAESDTDKYYYQVIIHYIKDNTEITSDVGKVMETTSARISININSKQKERKKDDVTYKFNASKSDKYKDVDISPSLNNKDACVKIDLNYYAVGDKVEIEDKYYYQVIYHYTNGDDVGVVDEGTKSTTKSTVTVTPDQTKTYNGANYTLDTAKSDNYTSVDLASSKNSESDAVIINIYYSISTDTTATTDDTEEITDNGAIVKEITKDEVSTEESTEAEISDTTEPVQTDDDYSTIITLFAVACALLSIGVNLFWSKEH